MRASNIIREILMDEVWSAVTSRDYRIVTALTQLLLKHEQLLNSQAALTSLANKLINDGSVAIGEVLDRIASIGKGTDPNIARKELVAAEKTFRIIGHDFETVSKGPRAHIRCVRVGRRAGCRPRKVLHCVFQHSGRRESGASADY